jgi:hypothetical protein
MPSSAYTELASGEDAYGLRWKVGTEYGGLVVTFGGGELTLDGKPRERFAEAVARAGMAGQRVHHGPECGCTPCLAEPSYEARRGG